jgi:hypothetical protein
MSLAISAIVNTYTTSMWLDAASSSNFTFSSSNIISTWNDRSKNSINATAVNNGGASYNLTLVSGSNNYVYIPSINGNNQIGLNIPNFYYSNNKLTLITVISFPTIATTYSTFLGIYASSIYPISLSFVQGYLQCGTANNGQGGFNSNHPIGNLNASTKYLFSMSITYDTFANTYNNGIFRINGVAYNNYTGLGSANGGVYQTSSSFPTQISYNYLTYNPTGSMNIYECIGIYNQQLGLSDIKTIEKYLNTKYSLGYTI